MKLLIQIETASPFDTTSFIGAVFAYVGTFAKIAVCADARQFERADRAGTAFVTFHEFEVDARDDTSRDEFALAISKFARDVRRRIAQEMKVEVLLDTPAPPVRPSTP